MLLKRVGTGLLKAARSPLLGKAVSVGRKVAGVADVLEVPFAGKVEKGLEVAEKALAKLRA